MMKPGNSASTPMNPIEIPSTISSGKSSTCLLSSSFAAALMGNIALTIDHAAKYNTLPTSATAA